jgi:hypothetical protein
MSLPDILSSARYKYVSKVEKLKYCHEYRTMKDAKKV